MCSRSRYSLQAIGLALILAGTMQASAATAQICGGDCNQDGSVTVDELVRGVNIALGTVAVDLCRSFDTNNDGAVTVDEIVAAVINALNGCPHTPTPTPTNTATLATPTPTSTPTTTPSGVPTAPARVLIATGDTLGPSNRTVTSLGVPILSPAGFVLVVGELTDAAQASRIVLLRLQSDDGSRVVLEQGQQIPGSSARIVDMAAPNAKASGSFAFAETDGGGSLVQITDTDEIVSLLGVGASAGRAGYEARSYVVPLTGGFAAVEAFAPGSSRALVAVPLNPTAALAPIIGLDDSLGYTNHDGDPVEGVVTSVDPDGSIMAEGNGGASTVRVDGTINVIIAFIVDEQSGAQVSTALAEGNQAPGLPPATDLTRLDGGVVLGGNSSQRGFAAFIEGPSFASFVTDSSYEALVVVEEGMDVPDVSGARIESPNTPVMGRQGAAVRYRRSGPGDAFVPAVGFADYASGTFSTLIAGGEAMPGGGTLAEIEVAFAINDTGQFVFRGDLEGGGAAYYALSTTDPETTLRRLVGTGDVVNVPGGGSATITGLGMIPATAGLGGEATAVGETQFTVGATLDQTEAAVLLVGIEQ